MPSVQDQSLPFPEEPSNGFPLEGCDLSDLASKELLRGKGSIQRPGWTHRLKNSPLWQAEQWRIRPRIEDWPDRMDNYEAAAYLRVSYQTLRSFCIPDQAGRAAIAHQRMGTAYRFKRTDLDQHGVVAAR